MGGLVTTYRAGMAVPDWPSTYGYNMFLYPLESWLKVWDVFLEHSHRLVAASVGILTIALALALWLSDGRRWVRWLGGAAVALVSLQGVLGGLRVIADERLLAKIHGCTAPLFFSLAATLVVVTSRAWREGRGLSPWNEAKRRGQLTPAVTVCIYLQIVAGAQLRHLAPQERTYWFAFWVWVHVIAAGLVVIGAFWILRRCGAGQAPRRLTRGAWLLAVLTLVQVVLGAATWVTNYGWPVWFTEYVLGLEYTVVAGGALQAVVTTAHVAVASLLLVSALSLALWTWRSGEGSRQVVPSCTVPVAQPPSAVLEVEAAKHPQRAQPGAAGPQDQPENTEVSLLRDCLRLTRPGIVAMVLATMGVAAVAASPGATPWSALTHAMIGSALAICGAIALNQRLERRGDALMVRTADRPLPSGRLTGHQATAFGIAASVAGIVYLAAAAAPAVAWLTAASWIVYVGMYTPLKARSAWQTPLGALAGAMPTLIGAAAVGETPAGTMPLVLFGIVYFWQFPHAMAIAWLHRADFAAASVKVASVVDPSGRVAGRIAMLGAGTLVPVSLVPWLSGRTGREFAAAAVVLGAGYLAFAVAFARHQDDDAARRLLRFSLVYLPAICAAMVWAVGRSSFGKTLTAVGFGLAMAGFPAMAAGQAAVVLPDRRYELSETVQLDRADGNAVKALAQAKAYLADKQFHEGINALIRVMETAGAKLVAATPQRYLPLRDACQRQLVALPPEALAAYRGRVDPEARRLYDDGLARRDPRRLLDVVDRFLASSWADDALNLLGEMALESGDPAAARSFWERIVPAAGTLGQPSHDVAHPPSGVLNSGKGRTAEGGRSTTTMADGRPLVWLGVPDTQLDLAAVRARLVLASILEGSSARAAEELSRFATLHPDARGWFGGRDANYVEALASLLAESARWPRRAPPGDWPTFAGSPDRNGIAPRLVDVAGVAWRVPLRERPAEDQAVAMQGGRPARVAEDPQRPLSYFPVIAGGRVFVNRGNREILALDLATGRAAWGKTAVIFRDDTEEEDAADPRAAAALGIPRFTATVFGDRLYARMGPAVTGRPHDAPSSGRDGYLVCLDLAGQGKLAWKVAPEPGWAFEGSPVADVASVYVAMRRSEVQPQAYVASFDAQSGQLRWRQFVCAADTPARGAIAEITYNLVTLHRNTLYLNTNLGAVAALNTSDGRLRWVGLYPRDVKGDLAKPPAHACRDLTPCLYDRGSLYVAPADARSVFAFDAASGQLLWQSGQELDDVVHLLGASGDWLIASGKRVYWISLKGPDQGRVRHVWPDGTASLGYGRGVLAGDCVLWPTREKIYRFAQATGRVEKVFDLPPKGCVGGNLLVAGDRLLIATPDELMALGETLRQPREPVPIAMGKNEEYGMMMNDE